MVRDLKAGDRLRTLGGLADGDGRSRTGKVVLVYNLDVAEDDELLRGPRRRPGARQQPPNLRQKPFDAVGAAGARRRPTDPAPRSMLGR